MGHTLALHQKTEVTLATLLIEQGVNLTAVQTRLGHAHFDLEGAFRDGFGGFGVA